MQAATASPTRRPAATLANYGIHIRNERLGENRCACPLCDKGPRDDALAVRVEPDGGATWTCFRCGWRGGIGADREYRQAERRPSKPSPHSLPAFDPTADHRWSRSRPVEPGTVAADYLAGRGCALPHPEGDLRWHPDVLHWPSGWAGPALVGLVTDPVTVAPKTLHLTFIRPDGSGKADLAPQRLYLPKRDKLGVVRLWPNEEITLGLCVAEGIETALSAALGFGLAWATLDAGNLGNFPVLDGIESLTVAVDHDRSGLDGFNAAAARWLDAGQEVRQWLPSEHGADINDMAETAA